MVDLNGDSIPQQRIQNNETSAKSRKHNLADRQQNIIDNNEIIMVTKSRIEGNIR